MFSIFAIMSIFCGGNYLEGSKSFTNDNILLYHTFINQSSFIMHKLFFCWLSFWRYGYNLASSEFLYVNLKED